MSRVALFLIVLAAYLVILPGRIDRLRPLAADLPAPTGDEPYYLEMALSLIRYQSLELTAVHYWDEGYRAFYPDVLLPHRAAGPLPYASKHFPGMAFLIVPAYWIGDTLSSDYGSIRLAVCVLLAILAALVVVNIALLAEEVGASRRWATLIALLLGATSPILSYSFLIFPELPAALLVVYAFRRGRLANGPWRTLLVGLAIAALPWLNPRLAAIGLPLAVWFLARSDWRRAPLVLLPGLASVVGIAVYDFWAFGSIWPNSGDHAGFGGPAEMLTGLAGLLFDRQWGLIVASPVLLLVFAGVVILARRSWRTLLLLSGVALPYVILIATYRQWWGEWCPPGRYLTPLLPLAAVPLAAAIPRDWSARIVSSLLAALSLAVSVIFVAVPRTMYNHPTGAPELWQRLVEVGVPNLGRYLPSLVVPDDTTTTVSWLWVGITLTFALFLALPHAQRR